jgi:AP2-associated kinase
MGRVHVFFMRKSFDCLNNNVQLFLSASRSMSQRRSPSPSRDYMRSALDSSNQKSHCLSNATKNKSSISAFWSTQHAQELAFVDDKWSDFDKEQATSKQEQDKNQNTPATNTTNRNLFLHLLIVPLEIMK